MRCQVITYAAIAKVRCMSMEDARRRVLRSFVSANGGHAKVVREYALSSGQSSYLSQLVAPGSDAAFGERSAANWEARLRMPPGSLVHPDSIDPDEFAFVRRADVSFANGVGKVAYHEDDKPPLVFRRDFLRKLGIAEGDAVVVDGVGHSNTPKIPEGSVVLVNKGDRSRLDGDFFAFRASGELLIKRLETLPKIGVLATAENPDFKPKSRVYTDGTDDFEVIGRAVWAGALL